MDAAVRTPVTVEAVVSVALDLLARGGLEAVSFRKIAGELGVSAPTLYWHVDSKRHLLDLMAERLVGRERAAPYDRPAAGEQWWEWLRRRGQSYFEILTSTRDAHLVLAGNRPTRDSLPGIDAVLAELVAVGLPPADALQTVFALGAYVGGSALEWQSEQARGRDGVDDSDVHNAIRDDAGYPVLAGAIAGLSALDQRATFEHGLDLLIAGLRSRYHAGTEPCLPTPAESG